MEKRLFIYNPSSGRKIISKQIKIIEDFYERRGISVLFYKTKYKGDAKRYLESLRDFPKEITVSGGDGTFSEVIEAVKEKKANIILSYIPSGSTNDFGRTIGLGKDLNENLQKTINGEITKIDSLLINSKSFVYVAAFGPLVSSTYKASQKMKNIFGYLSYVFTAFRCLFPIKKYRLEISYDDASINGEYIALIASSSYFVGSFKNVLKDITHLDDGKAEILLIKKLKNPFSLLRLSYMLLHGKFDKKTMLFLQSKTFYIKSENTIEWNIDGERGPKTKEVKIEVEKKGITIRR